MRPWAVSSRHSRLSASGGSVVVSVHRPGGFSLSSASTRGAASDLWQTAFPASATADTSPTTANTCASAGTSDLTTAPSAGFSARRLPLAIREELAVHRDLHAVALWIGHAVDIHLEVDGAHDAVAELLVNHFLERRAVDLHHLVETVDERVGGDGRRERSLRRRSLQPRDVLCAEIERPSHGRSLVGAHRLLSEQRRRRPDLAAPAGLGQRLPRQLLRVLGGDYLRRNVRAGHDGLTTVSVGVAAGDAGTWSTSPE